MAVFKFRNLKNGQATALPPGDFIVGRADDAYIHLEDPSVSRHHSKLYNTDEGFFIEDLGSANGTAFKGARITGRVRVEFGDVIYIGAVPFRIDPEVAGETSTPPSAGLRSVNRSYIRRDTEPIPLESVMASQELLTHGLLPIPRNPSAGKGDAESVEKLSSSETFAEKVGSTRVLEPQPALPGRSSAPAPETTLIPETEDPDPAPRPMAARWLLIIFLAGLGTGLLLGLYFAKVFLDLGGKASMLP